MHILPITHPEQLVTVRQLAYDTWYIAYEGVISEQQISYMLANRYALNVLEQQLISGQDFFLLYEAEQPVGFTAVQYKTDGVSYLHKLYCLPSEHGKGYGKQLLACAENRAKEQGANLLELNVNKYNKAVKFYLKMGFEVFREEVLPIGGGFVMDDFVMRKPLL